MTKLILIASFCLSILGCVTEEVKKTSTPPQVLIATTPYGEFKIEKIDIEHTITSTTFKAPPGLYNFILLEGKICPKSPNELTHNKKAAGADSILVKYSTAQTVLKSFNTHIHAQLFIVSNSDRILFCNTLKSPIKK